MNAVIEGGFRDVSNAGSRDRFNGRTDSNGVFIVEGAAMIGVGGRITAEGYYPTIASVPLDRKQVMKMRCWDVEVPVLLKPIKQPVPMCLSLVENPYVDYREGIGQYRFGCTSRYDIVKSDFLAPYGKGEVGDIEFRWHMAISSKDIYGIALDYDTRCEICMSNRLDGLCIGEPDGAEDGQSGSAYISDYEAPEVGYTNSISFYRNVRGAKVETNDDKHYLYYFRIRTQTNETGKLSSALYGKIYGHINGTFTYFLNPTPNDRNVEHDPKKNLFKGK